MTRRTDQLNPGDRVTVGRLTRTVREVAPSGYENTRGEPILLVWYREGVTAEWSGGNSAAASTTWELA